MTKLYILCGIAFSGKSTLAQKIAEHTGSKVVAFDQVWLEQDAKAPVPEGAEGWRCIREVAQKEVLSLLQHGISVVYDDNNPRQEHREELRAVANKAGADPVTIFMDTPLVVVRSREETNRSTRARHLVEAENFDKVLQDLEPPTIEEHALSLKPETNIDDFLTKLTQ